MSIKNRGFASMNKKRLAQLTSKGGTNAHLNGTAHQWDSDTGRKAGAKGNKVRDARRAGIRLTTAIDASTDIPIDAATVSTRTRRPTDVLPVDSV